MGSGFIIDGSGHALTNHHVIAHASDIRVILSDGREFRARVVGSDELSDIALLKIDGATGLVPARLGDSDRLEVGSWVMAIGNPFGLSHTVTAGIVSAKGRTAREVPTGLGANYYQSFIQTDASINPGNSGGPLVDLRGDVVGISTAVDTRGDGIGYAIPINMARDLLPMLKRDGRATRAWVGLVIAPVTPDMAAQLGLDAPRGAFVADVVPGGPAAAAGLRRGDVIFELGGRAVDDKTLPWAASTAGVGRPVRVRLWRDARELEAVITPARMP